MTRSFGSGLSRSLSRSLSFRDNGMRLGGGEAILTVDKLKSWGLVLKFSGSELSELSGKKEENLVSFELSNRFQQLFLGGSKGG